jgi:endonuclease-3
MKRESAVVRKRRERVGVILPILEATYPDARCSLDFTTPLELIVATILSAQCTDERVNRTTPALFKRYRTARAYASADPAELGSMIQSCGFFNQKAKSIQNMARALVEQHGGEVPRTMEELTKLAGVGRKTANVVLGNAFGINEGVTVDTHVARVSARLGLTTHADAVKIEQDLMPIVPRDMWCQWSHLLIHHGRAICRAPTPLCERCPLLAHCPTGPKIIRERAAKAARKAIKRPVRKVGRRPKGISRRK